MRLAELDARFVGHYDHADGSFRVVETLAEAQGVMFQCPLCAFGKERGEEDGRQFVIGAHYVICWFAGRAIPDDATPKPGRWIPSGTRLDDLTFIGPGAASVSLTSGCGWHGFVKNGNAT